MKDDTRTKESLKCIQCDTEFELVAKVNQNINNMQITQPFWNKWKHIENIDTEKERKKKQRTKIRYIKNNCLNITGINLSIQTMFDHMKIKRSS